MSDYKHLIKIDLLDKSQRFLKNNIADQLYFNNSNNSNLECDDENQIVWQQMTCENFCKFLNNEALYFKQLSKFKEGDERGLKFYERSYVEPDKKVPKNKFKKKLCEDFEKTVYISCWFDLPWLTKIVFEKYAGEEAGIAIGVSKEKLLKNLDDFFEKNDKTKQYEKIFYGNAGYIGNEHTNVVEPDEAIAPLFLKSKYHSSDNEFRLVYIRDSLLISNNNGLTLPEHIDSYMYMKIGEPNNFIKYIAVRDCTETFKCICEKFNLSFNESGKYKMDGFTIYEIE